MKKLANVKLWGNQKVGLEKEMSSEPKLTKNLKMKPAKENKN